MKKIILTTILLSFPAVLCAAQKNQTPAAPKPKQPETKSNAPKIAASSAVKPKPSAANTTEISAADWKTLADALTIENWEKSGALSLRFISRLKAENEKKQLARLRYFYLYSLSGKLFKLSAAKDAAGEKAVRGELKKSAAAFTGKEFVLPPRAFLGDCQKVFNYICTVKNNDRALRTTATGKNGTEILSFDYVLFDEKISVKEFAGNKTFLGGYLRKTEFNDDLSKPWVMRLIFDKGFLRIVLAG